MKVKDIFDSDARKIFGDRLLWDGVYFSKKAPRIFDRCNSDEIDETKVYICMPYETDTVFIWDDEKPNKMRYSGQANHGASLSFMAPEPGFYTVCMEND